MLILGIESSCDETAASVIKDGKEILSSIVSSQDMIHSKYGGVVPELASRRHIEMIIPVISQAIKKAKISLKEIDGIAATKGPGLVGSLLVGLSVAKSLSYCCKIPLVGVNHLAAHLAAINLTNERPDYPYIGLVVSGGHTNLYMIKSEKEIKLLGKTRDDAAGEAFDKVAKLLNMGYPGGILIEKESKGVDPSSIAFPRPLLKKGSQDFSFSGLKTAVLNLYREKGGKIPKDLRKQIASSFQEAVVDTLVWKLSNAIKMKGLKSGLICGGVAANGRLREKAESLFSKNGWTLAVPPKSLCTDNAAMIAAAGYPLIKNGCNENLKLNAKANLEIG